jgi:pyroglutamyl-peptidase
MQWIYGLVLLMTASVWAKPLIVLTHFDPFSGRVFNNSKFIAEDFKKAASNFFDIHLCELPTSFARSILAFEDCLKNAPGSPAFVLSLGETGCMLKVEHRAINFRKVTEPDNDRASPRGAIIPTDKDFKGMTYPLEEMYCSLSATDRASVFLSSDAGTFVCNDLAYKVLTSHPELSYGFIHVPTYSCRNRVEQSKKAVELLLKLTQTWINLPHRIEPLPTTRSELPSGWRDQSCLKTYYKTIKLR